MRVEFPKGFLTLRTESAIELVEHHLSEGTFWDFVAVLVEEKADNKLNEQLNEMKSVIELIKDQLASESSRGATRQNNSSLPSPDLSEGTKKTPPSAPKKASVDLSMLGDFQNLLARANKMGGDD